MLIFLMGPGVYSACFLGESIADLLYVELKFNWDAVDYSHYDIVRSIISFISK